MAKSGKYNDKEQVPTTTALWCHWLRTCLICMMWRNATSTDVYGTHQAMNGYRNSQ